MGYRVLPDGTIVAESLEEAIALQRRIREAAPAAKAAPAGRLHDLVAEDIDDGIDCFCRKCWGQGRLSDGGGVDYGHGLVFVCPEDDGAWMEGKPEDVPRGDPAGSPVPAPRPKRSPRIAAAPEGHRATVQTPAERERTAAHVRLSAISERKGKHVFLFWHDGRARWGGTFASVEDAAQARGLIADAIAAGDQIPKFAGQRGKRGPKPGRGVGGVYSTGSGTFRFKARINGRQVCGPSRVTREEAEADLVAAKAAAGETHSSSFTGSNQVPKEEEWPARAVKSLGFFADPATCAESQTDPSCLTGAPGALVANQENAHGSFLRLSDDASAGAPPSPLRRPSRTCSRCGIPGHNAGTCDAQPLSRDERLLAIEAWATRSRAPAPPAAPAPPIAASAARRFDPDEDLTEFHPDLVLPPEPAEPEIEFNLGRECTTCSRPGHLRGSCPGDDIDADPAPEAELAETPPPAAAPDLAYPDVRPATRGGCELMPRPCPFVTCKMHLAIEVSRHTGKILESFPGRDPDDLEQTCALDVADLGGVTLETVGRILNLTRERIRQVELHALADLADTDIDFEAIQRGSNAPEDSAL